MQTRRRRRGWGGPQGGLRGGNEKRSSGHNVKKNVEEENVETSSSGSDMEMSGDDEEALVYGSQGSELSALLDKELQQVEGEVLSVPDQGCIEVVDNILLGEGNPTIN